MNVLREDVYIVIGRKTPKCSYCENAKKLLEEKNIEFEYIDINERPEMIDFIKNVLKRSTVPQIRDDNGEWIGGYERLCESLRE